eukprot:6056670-Amphidinium_carterae.1
MAAAAKHALRAVALRKLPTSSLQNPEKNALKDKSGTDMASSVKSSKRAHSSQDTKDCKDAAMHER